MKRIWFSLIAAGLLTIVAVSPAAGQNIFSVPLDDVDDSGVSGGASIRGLNGEVEVTVLITEGLEDDAVHPVHIHDGTCDDLGGVAYPLEDIENGSSESTVEVSLADLMTGEYAINAHLSEDEMDVSVMCGNIPEVEDLAADDDAAVDDDDDAVVDDDDDAVVDDDDDAVVDDDDDAVVDDDDDAVVDDDDDAVVDDEDDAVVDDEDDAVVDDEDDAVVDDEDDAVVDDEDDAVVDDDDAVEDDDVAVVDDDEADDVEDTVPATGSIGGLGDEFAVLMMTLFAGATLGAGLLVRRRVQHQG